MVFKKRSTMHWLMSDGYSAPIACQSHTQMAYGPVLQVPATDGLLTSLDTRSWLQQRLNGRLEWHKCQMFGFCSHGSAVSCSGRSCSMNDTADASVSFMNDGLY